MVNEKITRKEAIAKGQKVYWKEKPCPRGHIGWTRVGGPCVECQKICSNNYKLKNKEQLEVKRKAYLKSEKGKETLEKYMENSGRESAAKRARERRQKYPEIKEKERLSNKKYKEKNKTELAKKRKVYASNPEVQKKTKATTDRWRAKNAEKIRESRREYYRLYMANRRATDPDFKMYTRMRDFVRRCVESIKGVKKWRTQDAVGYTPSELKNHIESLWQDGMSWDNYGKWHIDHIKSIKGFRDEGVDDLKIINALTNLQPLWAFDNLSKGA